MTWLAICHDVENSKPIREQYLPDHLAYIEMILSKIEVGGPLCTETEPEYNSSALIYRVEKESEALELLQNDPYYKAGLYASTELYRFNAVVGNWVGGKTW